MHLKISPQPPEIAQLPEWFADRVRIETDRLKWAEGLWMRVTPDLRGRLEKRLNTSDYGKRRRVMAVIEKLDEFLTNQRAEE